MPNCMPEKTGREADPRPDGKDLQRSGPRSLAGKIAAEDAGQSAERLVPRLAGCILPLATPRDGAATATERSLDWDVKGLGRGTKEDWWKQKETW